MDKKKTLCILKAILFIWVLILLECWMYLDKYFLAYTMFAVALAMYIIELYKEEINE